MEGIKAIDWIGVITVSGGTVMFLLGLEYGGVTYPWDSVQTICLIVFGLVTLGIFFINEWKFAKYPVMPLRLFNNRTNVASLLVCFIHGFIFISAAYYLPLYFQAVLEASPILSGVYLFPFVLSLSFMSIVVGVFIKVTGHYLPPIWFGMLFMAVGFGLFIDLPLGRDWSRLITFQIIAGLGVGPIFQAPLIALQCNVPPRDIATATALFGFVRNIATSMSVVIGGVIFQNRMMDQTDLLRAAVPGDAAVRLGSGGAAASTVFVQKLPIEQRRPVQRVYNKGLQALWIFYVAIGAIGVLVSFLIRKRKLDTKHQEYKSGLAQEELNRLEQKKVDAEKKTEKEERRRSKMESREGRRLSTKDGEKRGSKRWSFGQRKQSAGSRSRSRARSAGRPASAGQKQGRNSPSQQRHGGETLQRNMSIVEEGDVVDAEAEPTAGVSERKTDSGIELDPEMKMILDKI